MINRFYFYNAETSDGKEISGVHKHKSWFKNPVIAMNQVRLNVKGIGMAHDLSLYFRQFHELK